jgi:hypothetical protein
MNIVTIKALRPGESRTLRVFKKTMRVVLHNNEEEEEHQVDFAVDLDRKLLPCRGSLLLYTNRLKE